MVVRTDTVSPTARFTTTLLTLPALGDVAGSKEKICDSVEVELPATKLSRRASDPSALRVATRRLPLASDCSESCPRAAAAVEDEKSANVSVSPLDVRNTSCEPIFVTLSLLPPPKSGV